MAYTEEGMLDDAMLEAFELSYKVRFEEMKPEDSATFYYCFTKYGFAGSGPFYKYLQKSVSKTIRAFQGPHLRLMFHRFDDLEQCRLNRGVRGRLIEHCKFLIREKKLKGFDANEIYEQTRGMPADESTSNYDDSVIDMQLSSDDEADEGHIIQASET